MAKSILQEDLDTCYLCFKPATETHHVFGGYANRRLSEKYGLKVRLCHDCHTGKGGAQYEKDLNKLLKQRAQKAFESIHGHQLWMYTFRKNYL